MAKLRRRPRRMGTQDARSASRYGRGSEPPHEGAPGESCRTPQNKWLDQEKLPCEKGCQCYELVERFTVEKSPAMPLCFALPAWPELLCLQLLREFGVDIGAPQTKVWRRQRTEEGRVPHHPAHFAGRHRRDNRQERAVNTRLHGGGRSCRPWPNASANCSAHRPTRKYGRNSSATRSS
jgi:hypothetical protein